MSEQQQRCADYWLYCAGTVVAPPTGSAIPPRAESARLSWSGFFLGTISLAIFVLIFLFCVGVFVFIASVSRTAGASPAFGIAILALFTVLFVSILPVCVWFVAVCAGRDPVDAFHAVFGVFKFGARRRYVLDSTLELGCERVAYCGVYLQCAHDDDDDDGLSG